MKAGAQSQPQVLDITNIYSSGISVDDLRAILDQHGKIAIDYALWSIGFAQSPRDLVHNLLEASYVAETLGDAADSIVCHRIKTGSYPEVCRFELSTTDSQGLAEQVYELSVGLSAECEDEGEYLAHLEAIEEYQEEIDQEDREFHCPELVDDYFANQINGVYPAIAAGYDDDSWEDDEMEGESAEATLQRVYEKHPERRFGFWKSAHSHALGFSLYLSTDSWIVPAESDVEGLLTKHSGLVEVEAHEAAVLFSAGSYSFLVHRSALVHFPLRPLQTALRCAQVLNEATEDDTPDDVLLTYSAEDEEILDRYGLDLHAAVPRPRYLLSASGSSLIVEGGPFKFVLFPVPVKPNRAVELYDELSEVFSRIADFAGVTAKVRLPWETLNDESFEELCYDIIYHHPGFDPATIRKMGKSRSRDGQRDIVVYTRELPGRRARKYIFQCKYRKAGTSLTTTSSAGDIGDTILQHGAKGYGLMTPVVIDAALHDRVDAICERIGAESANWSVYEIERFLARHPRLVERHFGGTLKSA